MAFTKDDLHQLDRALLNGELEVRFADRTVRYHSKTEMLKVRELMVVEIGKAKRSRVIRLYHAGKGF